MKEQTKSLRSQVRMMAKKENEDGNHPYSNKFDMLDAAIDKITN